MFTNAVRLLLPLGIILSLNQAAAHEFILKPDTPYLNMGQSIRVEAISSHIFMVNEEMENLADVTLALYQGGQTIPIALSEQPQRNTLDGQVSLPQAGSALLLGHRLPQTWCDTTEGVQPGERAALESQGKTVISVNRYEKFAKTLLNPLPTDASYQQTMGQKLELLLLNNPAEINGSGKISAQVLLDGKPVQAEVSITYDGFSNEPSRYIESKNSDSQGMVEFQISQPGLWLLRSAVTQPQPQPDVDNLYLRATLAFPIKQA